MKNGWNEVARLGPPPGGYPHVLVDQHCWCLRMGPGRGQEKYYSNLPSLLQGLVEHVERARLRNTPLLHSATSMRVEVRVGLAEALQYGRRLCATIAQQWSISRFQPPQPHSSEPETFPPADAA
jgi:hypothetical protein